MKKSNESISSREQYDSLFFPNKKHQLDGPEPPPEEYVKWLESQKYSEEKKNILFKNIIKKNNLFNPEFVDKIKIILPNGLNDYYSITDSEYEALKAEFDL